MHQAKIKILTPADASYCIASYTEALVCLAINSSLHHLASTFVSFASLLLLDRLRTDYVKNTGLVHISENRLITSFTRTK